LTAQPRELLIRAQQTQSAFHPRAQCNASPRRDVRLQSRSFARLESIAETLPQVQLWYSGPNAASNAVDYAKFYSRSRNAVIRVYDEAGNVIETHEHAGDFKEW
jgi:hypothetical protein